LTDLSRFKSNDSVGKPRKYNFNGYGVFSPTTIRYISVAEEIRTLFGEKLTGQFIEIGAGYGGQYLVFSKFYAIQKYSIFDLQEVQLLIRTYLKGVAQTTNVEYVDLESFRVNEGTIIISNYAFSELPKALQIEYIEKVMRHCKFGYLIMNSGKSNLTGRSSGKLSLDELQMLLPKFEIFDEIPSTSEDNYVIAWGHRQ